MASFRTRLALLGLVVASAASGPQLLGHAAQPRSGNAFEVASVKPNKSEDNFSLLFLPGGRFTATNVPLRMIIATAYGSPLLRDFQIAGEPSWVNSDRFDITAKAAADDLDAAGGLPPARARVMIRTLLADRFRLAAHNEVRQLPIYELVFVTSGQFGPQLRQSGTECASASATRGAPPPPPPPPPPGPPGPGQRPGCGIAGGIGRLSAGGATM